MSGCEAVKMGVWLYDGAVQTDVRIVSLAMTYGSGDYQDPPEVQEDQDIPSFAIEWGSPGEPGIFRSREINFPTLEAAILHVENIFFHVVWRS